MADGIIKSVSQSIKTALSLAGKCVRLCWLERVQSRFIRRKASKLEHHANSRPEAVSAKVIGGV